jgi:quercetin dioxygenase-like cupin family protein
MKPEIRRIITCGELTLVLQEEVKLQAGDVVVQRGANHLWHNRTEEFARCAFIVIDAKYPDTGG